MEPRSPALQADPLPAEPQVKPINTLPCVKQLVETCSILQGAQLGFALDGWAGGERGGMGRRSKREGTHVDI